MTVEILIDYQQSVTKLKTTTKETQAANKRLNM